MALAGASEDDINLYCLKQAYPQISGIVRNPDGSADLLLRDFTRVPYSAKSAGADPLSGDVKESMAQVYPLEPERPDTPPGFAPGRKRPYALLEALYGDNPHSVRANLATAMWRGRKIQLAPAAAVALGRVEARLAPQIDAIRDASALLKPDGGFFWRKIAGSAAQSAHSYGIACDIGADRAPYWRWSRRMPHSAQKSWPAEIVKAFEEEGFIWGGKWHEYDIMHFEYRPELICKAKITRELEEGRARKPRQD